MTVAEKAQQTPRKPLPLVPLTPHQTAALGWLVQRVDGGAPLVALRGLAGTGKTTLIPALRQALTRPGRPVAIGTPTHRAAMILRGKGLQDATTLHALALTPYFTPDYAEAMQWLGEDVETPADGMYRTKQYAVEPDDVPALVAAQLETLGCPTSPEELSALRGQYDASRILSSIGLHGRNYLIGFGPKPRSAGVLLLDEASMVGQDLLTLCQKAFRQVVLIGDPGQLPPVNDVAVLDQVAGVQLTEIHRQAADSPILRLAYQARRGVPFWRYGVEAYGPDVWECAAVPATAFLESPLITWRNKTRLHCTRMIREALDYPPDRLVVGEPLVCRATDAAARADGFYNNALYRVASIAPDHARAVSLREDLTGADRPAQVHIEDLDGDPVELDSIPFRFGYCLTAHTAQGGEWPTVYLSVPDLTAYAGFCWHQGRQDELARWAYTAVTRAKDGLGLVTQHCLLKE